MKSVAIALLTCICSHANAQVVQDPLADCVNLDKKWGADYPYFPARVYYKWVLDINHDGNQEILLADKPTQKEREDEQSVYKVVSAYQPEQYKFLPYFLLKNGKYLRFNAAYIDVSQCHVGYIKELKLYGIVTVENEITDDPNEPDARHGVLREQVIAYTIREHNLVAVDLTPLFDPDEKNSVYDEYLATSKLTQVHLREVTPSASK